MIARVLEPEVMDSAREAAEYDAMDHAAVNRVFVDDLLVTVRDGAARREPRPPGTVLNGAVLDLGTGTALIPIELCLRDEFDGRVVGVDLAEEMLTLARRNVAAAGLSERVRVEVVDAKSLPYEDGNFDVVMSNSIVHHIPEPADVLREMVRVVKPGGVLFVRDLLRPETETEVERLVATYAGSEATHSQQLFRQSLQAALTVAEMRDLVAAISLSPGAVQQTSDRHWTLVLPADERTES